MTTASVTSADSDVRIEVAFDGPPKSVGVRTYTHVLEQVLLSLEEIDRFALPGRTPRIDWAIADVSQNGELRAVIAPRRTPPRRPIGTVSAPASGFVLGVSSLKHVAEIPALFSPLTVDRVMSIGKPIGVNGLERVAIRTLGDAATSAVVDSETLDHARLAISVSRTTFGSVVGRLDVLSARPRTGPRGQVLVDGTRRAVTIRAAADQMDQLREAWSHRVMVAGELRRNAVGQPLQIDMTELRILPDSNSLSAREILGIAPDWTEGLTTADFVRQARRA